MRFYENTPQQSDAIERPTCSTCGRNMWLTRVAPYRLNHDKRTFECPLCLREEALIVKFK